MSYQKLSKYIQGIVTWVEFCKQVHLLLTCWKNPRAIFILIDRLQTIFLFLYLLNTSEKFLFYKGNVAPKRIKLVTRIELCYVQGQNKKYLCFCTNSWDRFFFKKMIRPGYVTQILIYISTQYQKLRYSSDVVLQWLSLLHNFIQETKVQRKFKSCLGVSEIRNGEDLWQWSRLEIRLNAFRQLTISQKQFIIIFIKRDFS